VQKDTDGIVILRLSKNENGIYELHFKQEFEIPGVMHMNIWFGMNQLYLGITSKTRISIYVWLGENFDKIDTLPYGARKLLFFQSNNFIHIVVVGSFTKILRFSVRSNKFIEMQKLRYANDANTFYFKKDHLEERFLILADNESTILYKEMYGRFVNCSNKADLFPDNGKHCHPFFGGAGHRGNLSVQRLEIYKIAHEIIEASTNSFCLVVRQWRASDAKSGWKMEVFKCYLDGEGNV